MPLSPLDSVAVRGAGRSWEVVLEGAPFSCGVWMGVGGHIPLPAARRVGDECAFWAEAGMCMLTRSLLLEPSSSGVGRADCRYLQYNAITELVATLFDKLTSLKYLYVTLDAAMHTPFPS
jgi:hypothetical protein